MKNSNQIYLLQVCVIVTSLLISTNFTYAQAKEITANDKFYWLNLGLGGSTVGEDGSAALNLNATYQFGRNVLSLRALKNAALFKKEIEEYGLLYGLALTSPPFLASFGGGVAVVSGTIDHSPFSPDEKIDPTIGLPLEVQLFWRPFRLTGVGLYGFANVNSEESYVGGTIGLQFGKLR